MEFILLKSKRKALLGWKSCNKSVHHKRVKQGGELNIKPGVDFFIPPKGQMIPKVRISFKSTTLYPPND